MSTTREVLKFSEGLSLPFQKKFDFVLDTLDHLFTLQDKVGLEEQALDALSEIDQARVKTFIFLVTSSNTTALGILRLLSGNLFADVYSLLRMLYEVACLLHYGSHSPDQSIELYRTFFKSGLPEMKHKKAEWELIKKATRELEQDKPELVKLRQYMNNFGSHISRVKVVLGNVSTSGQSAVSSISAQNFSRREFIMALDLLILLQLSILEAYNTHCKQFLGAAPSVASQINTIRHSFAVSTRPRLQALVEDYSIDK